MFKSSVGKTAQKAMPYHKIANYATQGGILTPEHSGQMQNLNLNGGISHKGNAPQPTWDHSNGKSVFLMIY